MHRAPAAAWSPPLGIYIYIYIYYTHIFHLFAGRRLPRGARHWHALLVGGGAAGAGHGRFSWLLSLSFSLSLYIYIYIYCVFLFAYFPYVHVLLVCFLYFLKYVYICLFHLYCSCYYYQTLCFKFFCGRGAARAGHGCFSWSLYEAWFAQWSTRDYSFDPWLFMCMLSTGISFDPGV